jgi:PKD repeat protein
MSTLSPEGKFDMKKTWLSKLFIYALFILVFQAWAGQSFGNEYVINLDASVHQKFGLYYPATYKFSIPPGITNLIAQFKYSAEDAWKTLPGKNSSDTFNGIDAVRFDYAGEFAYISVSFSRTSDNILLRIIDGSGQPVNSTFISIPQYYDGRKGVVTITLDDWADWSDSNFRTATDYLASNGLYFTVGIITAPRHTSASGWNSIQQKIDQHGDYLEIASHSWDHACDAQAYEATGYEVEIIGSRDAIRNNLTFKASPYVPLYIEPCGYSDASIVNLVTAGDYLLTRKAGDWSNGLKFVLWDSIQGRYGRATESFSTYSVDMNFLNGANSAFDQAMAQGGIYLLLDHPYSGFWYDGSYLLQHLNHIKGRNDVWYVPLGQLYLYHFLQEMRGNLSIKPVATEGPVAQFTASPLSGVAPLLVTFTDTSTGTITGWSWDFGDGATSDAQNPTHTYNNAGSYTARLTVTGPDGSDTKTQSITVSAPTPAPVARFSASPLSGVAPLLVTFTDTSTGTITGWSWDFGDGATSTVKSPTHTYNKAGSYTARLTVTGPGGSDTQTRRNYVRVRKK